MKDWPSQIPDLDLEFLSQILRSPWPWGRWIYKFSPASLVLRIARHRGFISGASREWLLTALQSYLEGMPEIAATEFLCIDKECPGDYKVPRDHLYVPFHLVVGIDLQDL